MNLKEAQQQDKLNEFTKQAEVPNYGDRRQFESAIDSIVQNSKSTPETSAQDSNENCSGTRTL